MNKNEQILKDLISKMDSEIKYRKKLYGSPIFHSKSLENGKTAQLKKIVRESGISNFDFDGRDINTDDFKF